MFTLSLIVLSVVAILWLALLLSPLHAWTHRHPLDSTTPLDGDDTATWPSVSIVVPGRNEERWLPITIPSYCRQDYRGAVDVVMVDDQSEDDSPAILEKQKQEFPNLTVLQGAQRPPGWCGKPWAVHQGVERAKGEWLAFTDSDCVFHPLAIQQTMKLARVGGYDAVSLLAQMEFGSSLERVGLAGLATVLNMIMPMAASNDPRSNVAIAAGGFILVKRTAYDAVGGHEGVKGHLVEDVQLGRKLKSAGFKLHTRATGDLVRTRMYEGFDDLWEGLAKNAYAGMDYAPEKFWVGLIVSLLVAVLPPVYLFVTLLWALDAHAAKAWLLVGLSALIVACQSLMHLRTVQHFRLPAWHCVLMPASAAMYTAATCWSAYQNHYAGGNVWKGRQYARPMLLEAVKPPTTTPNSFSRLACEPRREA